MNVREMRQLIHDLDDDDQIEFGVDGSVYAIDANILVKEWNTLYLGVDKDDLTESMIEHEMANSDDPGPSEDDEWPEDREAFIESLAAAEDGTFTPVGDCCELPPPPPAPVVENVESTTEMM